ncbi:DUF3649 domain-containing protein [Stutzerimonas kirkiae]|uniref:Iron transporter n=1 Tax=Stutzerimonas kirkiae TaxID=2211392 RepID=A0A4Q9RF50_9GAMM|nr:DUF3649 domain-containing protein [Stutzerimonas kirkiae]TBU99821.1 iron transporter [Stutzerimonas kirkiae]TBV05247.1 iron transporter [Stutzerimonas kirkiae]TBV08148.1 iron transporter [Stutzerimonas kirkiae]TBV17605.1 iron transporter [Stutzerimonas kirkiae]
MNISESARYRWRVASRVLAAVLGGYALTSVVTVLLALIWPTQQAHAVLAATLLSFAVYACVVIWVFSTRSATRAWLGMVLPTVVLALVCWMLLPGGAA